MAVKAENQAICSRSKGRKRQERSLPPSADFANVVSPFWCFALIDVHRPGALS
jgi:hypothetical protein